MMGNSTYLKIYLCKDLRNGLLTMSILQRKYLENCMFLSSG
jgi:hypothetical protein